MIGLCSLWYSPIFGQGWLKRHQHWRWKCYKEWIFIILQAVYYCTLSQCTYKYTLYSPLFFFVQMNITVNMTTQLERTLQQNPVEPGKMSLKSYLIMILSVNRASFRQTTWRLTLCDILKALTMSLHVPLWWDYGLLDCGNKLCHSGQCNKFQFHLDLDIQITAFERLVETAPV